MMTEFYLLMKACGLSQQDAATILGVRIDTIKSWATGRRTPSDGVIMTLVDLIKTIETAANGLADTIRIRLKTKEYSPLEIDLGYACDDAEAISIGWPCAAAQRAAYARAIAQTRQPGVPFRLIPRGSTPPTAGAADAHDALLKRR